MISLLDLDNLHMALLINVQAVLRIQPSNPDLQQIFCLNFSSHLQQLVHVPAASHKTSL